MNQKSVAIGIGLALVAVVIGACLTLFREPSAPDTAAAEIVRVKREDERIRLMMAKLADEHARTKGSLEGKVVDRQSGQPLYDVQVVAGYLGSSTDRNGAFRINLLEPGVNKIEADRADLTNAAESVNIVAGKTARVTLKLGKAPPPCCRLEGKWHLTLGIDQGTPAAESVKTVSGTVRFRSGLWARFFGKKNPEAFVNEEFGDYDVDLRPFFGDDFAAASSSSLMPSRGWGWTNTMTEASGSVRSGDMVEVSFIRQLSHGGLALGGKLGKDGVIRGRWLKRDYAPTHGGVFVMTKM